MQAYSWDLQGASKAHDFATNLSRGPREYLVAVRSEGQFLGEMAMFATAAVRCASVRAKGPVRVKIVPGEELMDLSPEVQFTIAVTVCTHVSLSATKRFTPFGMVDISYY